MCYIAWQSYVKWESVMTLMSLAYVTRVMVFAQKSQIQVYSQPLKKFTSTVLQGEVSFVFSGDMELSILL